MTHEQLLNELLSKKWRFNAGRKDLLVKRIYHKAYGLTYSLVINKVQDGTIQGYMLFQENAVPGKIGNRLAVKTWKTARGVSDGLDKAIANQSEKWCRSMLKGAKI